MKKRYIEYLNSDKWYRIRLMILDRDNHKCTMCSSTKNLEIHHKTYKYVYQEEKHLYSLTTLCRYHHYFVHNKWLRVLYVIVSSTLSLALIIVVIYALNNQG